MKSEHNDKGNIFDGYSGRGEVVVGIKVCGDVTYVLSRDMRNVFTIGVGLTRIVKVVLADGAEGRRRSGANSIGNEEMFFEARSSESIFCASAVVNTGVSLTDTKYAPLILFAVARGDEKSFEALDIGSIDWTKVRLLTSSVARVRPKKGWSQEVRKTWERITAKGFAVK